jgi:hypothetical protein
MSGSTTATPIPIEAFLLEGQTRVLPALHGLIYDCGGWILFRDHPSSNLACFLLEFPRDICVEIYSCLVSVGLELAPAGHRALSELCRCTPFLFDAPTRTVKAADPGDLEKATEYICSLEMVQIRLTIRFIAEAMPVSGHIQVA